jgi:hypothetical protein
VELGGQSSEAGIASILSQTWRHYMNREDINCIEDEQDVEDESEKDRAPAPVVYNITSYGADYDVAGLVKRMRNEDVTIPTFQRAYVWDQEDASAFIESLLLGLPIPGVFLATEKDTNKLLVIDGQQRLRTLQFYYDGFFDPKMGDEKKKVFKLIEVQAQLEGKTYATLSENDRRRLDNSILHATIIKQESPQDGDTSICHIFHRLNAGGMILKPQEIRRAAFHGLLLDKITQLNSFTPWRDIFGKKNKRLKDEELILRFLALYFKGKEYKKPMEEFLNTFASKQKTASEEFLGQCEKVFKDTIGVVVAAFNGKPFRLVKGINAAIFDSVMVGLSTRLAIGPITDIHGCQKAYNELLIDTEYRKAVTDGTSDESAVEMRLRKAVEKFAAVK